MTLDDMKPLDPHRRRADASLPVRVMRFLLAPVVDQWKGLSLTRFLAIYYAVFLWHALEEHHAISANVLWLAALTVATAFGKSTFEMLATRMSLAATSSQVDKTRRTIVETIQTERRASDADHPGTQATP